MQSVIKKKMRIEGGGKQKEQETEVHVEVSIIEKDALVELECRQREGLLLDVMKVLRQLRVEIIAIQSSISKGVLVAELRGKVRKIAASHPFNFAVLKCLENEVDLTGTQILA